MGIVVIAVLVTFLEGLGGSVLEEVIKVVLDHRRIGCEIPFGELVDVDIVVSAKQIIKNLVVLSAVPLVGKSSGDSQELDRIPFAVESEVEIVLIHTSFLDHILGTIASIRGVQRVDSIETIPVKMSGG